MVSSRKEGMAHLLFVGTCSEEEDVSWLGGLAGAGLVGDEPPAWSTRRVEEATRRVMPG